MPIKKQGKEKERALKPEINLNNIWKLGSHITSHCISITKNSILILCSEIIAVYSANHVKTIHKLCGQMHELFILMHMVHTITIVLWRAKWQIKY
jgi:hypothetical protein